MDRRLIDSSSALAGNQFNFQPGRVHGAFLIFSGENATGETGALSDLGSVVMTRDNRQIINAKIVSLANMCDIRFGSNLFSSTEADTFLASAFIPFFEGDPNDSVFNNALNIVDEKELNFEWVPAAGIDDIFDNVELKVYAELATYRENYEYRILRDDQNEDGPVASKPYQLNKQNISALYLVDPDDVVDLIQLEQNERTIYSPQDWDILEAGTLKDNRLETSTFDMIQLQSYSKGIPASTVNRDSILSVTTSGSGKIEILETMLHWWSNN